MSDAHVVVVQLPSGESSTAGGQRTVIVNGQATQGTTLSGGQGIAYPGGIAQESK